MRMVCQQDEYRKGQRSTVRKTASVRANKRHRNIFCALQLSYAENCLGGPGVLRDRLRGTAVAIALVTAKPGQTWPDATTLEGRDQIQELSP